MLDAQHRPIGVNVVSVGSLTASLVHPRESFKAAILSNSAAVIVAHNHPSGSVEPSPRTSSSVVGFAKPESFSAFASWTRSFSAQALHLLVRRCWTLVERRPPHNTRSNT